jgi:hypothetical protein
MRKLFVLLIVFWAPYGASAQLLHKDLEQRYLTLPDQSLQFQVCADDLSVKPADHLVYYWVSAGKLHHSKGDYHGELLHGNFTSFFENRQLKSKGEFRKGLKNKVWKTWYPSGELKSITSWKKGVQHGQRKSFSEEGKLESIAHYRHGRLHGEQSTFSNDSVIGQEEYKKGQLQLEEVAPVDTMSQEAKILEMITPENAEAEPEVPKERWFKRILPRRKAKKIEEDPQETKVEEAEPGA